MGPHEIYTRSGQELGKRRDVLLHRLGADPFRPPDSGLDVRGRFFCGPAQVPEILRVLRRRMPEQAGSIVRRAGRILEGRFDLLGYDGLDFGRTIDWHLDPVSGKRAPLAPWPSIPFLDFAAVGDHKVTWELNRHQFLVTLAKAYRLTGETRFAESLKTSWYDWVLRNPYPLGINWASTLEVAFRALSWMWMMFLLEDTPAASAGFQRDVTREIARAAWYIDRFPSTYFSPNTHLLGEGIALFLLGTRYPALPGAARWRRAGWRIALAECRRQVRADGLHFEQSTYYHVYALDFFLHARLMAAASGSAVSADLDATIRGMLAALAELAQAGALPRFGDDDGGRLFDGARNRPEQMLDPLSTGAVVFRDPAMKAVAAGLSEESLWLCGPDAEEVFDSLPAAASPLHSAALQASGVYAMAAGTPDAPALLFLDAGEHGPYGAGHGHADALSIQLASSGRPWLVDPGTCVYAGRDRQRDRFRATPAHNTVTVNELSQADPAQPFSWGILPRVELSRWTSGAKLDLFDARHSGYRRLSPPVTHRRWVAGLRQGLWLVRDIIETDGDSDIDLYWHFAPDLGVALHGSTVTARHGNQVLAIVPSGEGWTPVLETGRYSPAYGQSIAAPVARWSARVSAGAEFAVMLGFGEDVARGALQCLDSSAHEPKIYEFAAGEARHCFYCARRPGVWQAGPWATDASLLYNGGQNLVVAAGGSRLEYDGRVLFQSAESLPYWEGTLS
jgi:hypothetical protein